NFLNKFPDSELRPEAFLYLGKAYTLIENNDAAVKTLRKLIAEYPNTQYSQYANRFIQELETK
ncbi:MAG: tetratricopeptide repeat protein, partial [Lentisphaerae bacterium]|nr:tetratricopeptide repeat protein [Lentisphaerota bacterium]